MSSQRKQWSEEQKLAIVLATLRDEQSIAELSRQHGVSDNLIYKWKAQFIEGSRQAQRLYRTFKYDFIFLHEVNVLDDLKRLAPQFRQWYNQERLHSSLGYRTPWQKLLADAATPS